MAKVHELQESYRQRDEAALRQEHEIFKLEILELMDYAISESIAEGTSTNLGTLYSIIDTLEEKDEATIEDTLAGLIEFIQHANETTIAHLKKGEFFNNTIDMIQRTLKADEKSIEKVTTDFINSEEYSYFLEDIEDDAYEPDEEDEYEEDAPLDDLEREITLTKEIMQEKNTQVQGLNSKHEELKTSIDTLAINLNNQETLIVAQQDVVRRLNAKRGLLNLPSKGQQLTPLIKAQTELDAADSLVVTIATKLQKLKSDAENLASIAQQMKEKQETYEREYLRLLHTPLAEKKTELAKLEKDLKNNSSKLQTAKETFNRVQYFPYPLFDAVLEFFGRPTYKMNAWETYVAANKLQSELTESIAVARNEISAIDTIKSSLKNDADKADNDVLDKAKQITQEERNLEAAKTASEVAKNALGELNQLITDADKNLTEPNEKLRILKEEKSQIGLLLEEKQLAMSSIDSEIVQLRTEIETLQDSIVKLTNQPHTCTEPLAGTNAEQEAHENIEKLQKIKQAFSEFKNQDVSEIRNQAVPSLVQTKKT